MPPTPRKRILLAFHWYSEALHRGALKYCVERGWEAVTLNSDTLAGLQGSHFDGILGMLPRDGHPIRDFVAGAKVPVVELSTAYPENTHWGRCHSDMEVTGRIAADYLRRLPVASFVFVSTGPWPAHDARWEAFRTRLSGDPRPCVRHDTGPITPESAAQLADFLKRRPKPVAVFGSVDESARHTLDAALGAGIAVPGGIFILGYGNREFLTGVAPVPISTIDINYVQWAYEAMGLLARMMSGVDGPGTTLTFLPGGVIERESTRSDTPRSRPRILLAFHWYSEALHEGALRRCAELDLEACVVNGDNAGEFPPGSFDGVIGMLPPEDHPVHRLVADSGVPVVELSPSYPENKHWVRCPSDGAITGRMAADYLRRRPVGSFLFVAHCPWPTHDARWAGFRAGLAGDARPCVRFDAAVPGIAPPAIKLDKGDPDPDATARLAEFMKELPRPVGVFGSVDLSARQALDAALQAGLTVPGDVFLMGFGNREHLCRTAPVPLTSIAIDYSEWGYAATGMLMELMAGRLIPGTVVPFPPSGVVARASTGGESGGDPLCEKAHALMREHLADHLTVAGMAKKLGVSKPTLERAFAAAYGEGVAKRHLHVRMEAAKAMLAAGDKSESVAAGVGFASYSAFGKAFQKVVGETPGAFARRHTRGAGRKQG